VEAHHLLQGFQIVVLWFERLRNKMNRKKKEKGESFSNVLVGYKYKQ
jgi:hypothetical protein